MSSLTHSPIHLSSSISFPFPFPFFSLFSFDFATLRRYKECKLSIFSWIIYSTARVYIEWERKKNLQSVLYVWYWIPSEFHWSSFLNVNVCAGDNITFQFASGFFFFFFFFCIQIDVLKSKHKFLIELTIADDVYVEPSYWHSPPPKWIAWKHLQLHMTIKTILQK